jgi:hypothetical protein
MDMKKRPKWLRYVSHGDLNPPRVVVYAVQPATFRFDSPPARGIVIPSAKKIRRKRWVKAALLVLAVLSLGGIAALLA